MPDDAVRPPEPPADLAARRLRWYPLGAVPSDDVRLAAGTTLWRVHDPRRRDGDPRWFGPAPGTPPRSRFDDPRRADAHAPGEPDGSFGTCDVGASREAAFAESFLRRPRGDLIDRATLEGRHLAELITTRPLRLVALLGPGLAAAGATAAVTSGPHTVARRWARALWRHPAAPDGIAYRCRHDDGEVAIALFDRACDAIAVLGSRGLTSDRLWLGTTLDRYLLALDPP